MEPRKDSNPYPALTGRRRCYGSGLDASGILVPLLARVGTRTRGSQPGATCSACRRHLDEPVAGDAAERVVALPERLDEELDVVPVADREVPLAAAPRR